MNRIRPVYAAPMQTARDYSGSSGRITETARGNTGVAKTPPSVHSRTVAMESLNSCKRRLNNDNRVRSTLVFERRLLRFRHRLREHPTSRKKNKK